MGYASAEAMVLLLVVMLLTFVQFFLHHLVLKTKYHYKSPHRGNA